MRNLYPVNVVPRVLHSPLFDRVGQHVQSLVGGIKILFVRRVLLLLAVLAGQIREMVQRCRKRVMYDSLFLNSHALATAAGVCASVVRDPIVDIAKKIFGDRFAIEDSLDPRIEIVVGE